MIRLERSFTNLVLLLAFVLLLVAGRHFWMVFRYSVDVPVGDEWEALRNPEFLGQFNLAWIFEQHNEHRIVLTKVQTWLLYRWNSWNIHMQIVQNFLIYAALVSLLIAMLGRTKKHAVAVAFFGAVFLFSTRSFENHSWGFQSQFHFVLLFSIAACGSLFQSGFSWQRILLGSLWSVLAIYSFSSGVPMILALSLVFASFVAFKQLRFGAGRRDLFGLLAFLSAIGFNLALYFSYNYHRVQGHPQFTLPYQAAFWEYFAHLLASGFGITGETVWPGLALFTLLLVPLVALAWRQMRSEELMPEFWLLIGICAIIFAAMAVITIGRAGFGIVSARSSRYVEITAILIPVTLCLWFCVLDLRSSKQKWLFGFLLALILSTHRKAWSFKSTYQEIARQRTEGLACIKAALAAGRPISCGVLYPWEVTDKVSVAQKLEVSFIKRIELEQGLKQSQNHPSLRGN